MIIWPTFSLRVISARISSTLPSDFSIPSSSRESVPECISFGLSAGLPVSAVSDDSSRSYSSEVSSAPQNKTQSRAASIKTVRRQINFRNPVLVIFVFLSHVVPLNRAEAALPPSAPGRPASAARQKKTLRGPCHKQQTCIRDYPDAGPDHSSNVLFTHRSFFSAEWTHICLPSA